MAVVFRNAMIVVDISLGLLCFVGGECYPALVGNDTPRGTFALERREVLSEGYRGDVLQFHETETHIFAIHRVWSGDKRYNLEIRKQHRTPITKGCINVEPSTYLLIDPGTTLIVQD